MGLPIHRLDGTPKARVFAYADELDRWLEEKLKPHEAELENSEIKTNSRLKTLITPALVILVMAAIALVTWRIVAAIGANSPTFSAARPTLAVLHFENKSGDKKLDFWRSALPELLITDLSQSRYIRLVSGNAMLTILRRLGMAEAQEYSSEDIAKIAAQARATHILRGTFIKVGESIIITAGLQKPSIGEATNTIRLEARGENDIIPKVDELTRQIKEELNLTAAQIAGDIEKEAGKITTSSPEALRYYIEGRRRHWTGESEQAIPYYEKAIAIDPEFAMAYRALATAHDNLNHIAERRKYLEKATKFSARLPENARLVIEGQRYYWNEDYPKAIEVLETLLKTYPGNALGAWHLSMNYFAVGDLEKAIERRQLALKTECMAVHVEGLAGLYSAAGMYQKAENVCRSFLQDVENNWRVRRQLVNTYVCRRQFDLALAEAERNYLLNPRAKADLGRIQIFKDDLAGAEDILGGDALLLIRGQFNRNVNLSRENLEKSRGDRGNEARAYGGLANALEKAGRYEEAYHAFNQYMKLSEDGRKSAPESGMPYLPSQQKHDLFARGRIQVEMRSFDEARKTAEELKSLIEKGINMKEMRDYEYTLGLVELGNKNVRKAVDLFRRASGRLDFETGWIAEDPSVSDLALYLNGLAQAYHESGDLDMARLDYEKITMLTFGRLDHGDIYAKAFYMLGKIAEQQGDKARAGQSYRKFLDLWKDADPGLPEVADAKRRLAGL